MSDSPFKVREVSGRCGHVGCRGRPDRYALPVFVGGRRLRLVHGVLGLALGASIVGCSGSSDSPTTLPPISQPPSTTPSTQPPTDPKAAAVAVVREYFRLLNAPTSVDTATALRALMTDACTCQQVADSTESVARRGQHYFGRTTARHLTPNLDGANAAEVLVDYDYTSSGIANHDGSIVSKSPGRIGATLDFRLRQSASGWLINALIYVRKGHLR